MFSKTTKGTRRKVCRRAPEGPCSSRGTHPLRLLYFYMYFTSVMCNFIYIIKVRVYIQNELCYLLFRNKLPHNWQLKRASQSLRVGNVDEAQLRTAGRSPTRSPEVPDEVPGEVPGGPRQGPPRGPLRGPRRSPGRSPGGRSRRAGGQGSPLWPWRAQGGPRSGCRGPGGLRSRCWPRGRPPLRATQASRQGVSGDS